MFDFTVRKAVQEDAYSIYLLSKSALGYDYPPTKTADKLKVVLTDSTQAVFVACANEKVVGYIHLANYDVLYAPNYQNILGLAVDADFRRCGVGSALLTAAEKWAQSRNACGIRLCSGAARIGAHAFYKQMGYTETKIQKNFKKEV